MIDANQWLCEHAPKAKLAEPCRGVSLAEVICPGDVLDDGTILTSTGILIDRGGVYVNERAARAAAYYGWREVVTREGIYLNPQTGERMHLVQR